MGILYIVLVAGTFGGYLVEEMVVPVMGAVVDHCDGYVFGR